MASNSIFLQGNPRREMYLQFSQDRYQSFYELTFQQDGASPYCSFALLRYLDETSHECTTSN